MKEKIRNSVKLFLKVKNISLKKAMEKGYVKLNRKGEYVLTGKGNKYKQNNMSTNVGWFKIR